MLNRNQFTKCIAVAVLFALVVATTPLSASDFSSKSILGSVSSVGSVDLRGVQIPDEATIFSGDQLRAGDGAYAKVLLVNGQKIELGTNTALKFGGQSGNLNIELQSGTLAISSVHATPIHITVGVFEITSTQPLTGNLGIVANDFVDLKVLAGSASVRNLKTKQSYVVQKNQERLFGLKTFDVTQPLAQIASNVPPPVPQTPTPAGQTTGAAAGSSSSHAALWILVAAAAIGTTVGVALATSSTKPPAAVAAQKTVQAALSTSQTATSTLNQISTETTAANNAINAATNLPPATKATLLAQAAALQSAATASQQQVATLQIQLQQLQNQLSGASGPQITAIQNQINTVTNSLNTEVTNLNNEINALNALVAAASAAGVPNVPPVPVTIQPIPPVTEASASVIP